MNGTKRFVLDGRLDDAFRGRFERRKDEIIRRIEDGTLPYDRVMTELQAIVEGRVTIAPVKYIVDLDVDPMIPNGWKVESHIKCGKFKFDPTSVELYLDEGQKDGKLIEGNKLRKKLEAKTLFNANLLDFYLAHPELIPADWKEKYVFFWGTIYHNVGGSLCVRCLSWDGDRWNWDFYWLVNGWDVTYLAACRK